MECVKQLVQLTQEKERLEAELKLTGQRINEVIPQVEEFFIQSGLDELRVFGRKVRPVEEIWAKIADKQAAIEALEAAGLTEYIKPAGKSYNSQSVSAFVRECVNQGEDLPESFAGVIEINRVPKIKVTA